MLQCRPGVGAPAPRPTRTHRRAWIAASSPKEHVTEVEQCSTSCRSGSAWATHLLARMLHRRQLQTMPADSQQTDQSSSIQCMDLQSSAPRPVQQRHQPAAAPVPGTDSLAQQAPMTVSRRSMHATAVAALVSSYFAPSPLTQLSGRQSGAAQALSIDACRELYREFLTPPLDYSKPGPMSVARLPRLEQVCTSCFGSCASVVYLLLSVLLCSGRCHVLPCMQAGAVPQNVQTTPRLFFSL